MSGVKGMSAVIVFINIISYVFLLFFFFKFICFKIHFDCVVNYLSFNCITLLDQVNKHIYNVHRVKSTSFQCRFMVISALRLSYLLFSGNFFFLWKYRNGSRLQVIKSVSLSDKYRGSNLESSNGIFTPARQGGDHSIILIWLWKLIFGWTTTAHI